MLASRLGLTAMILSIPALAGTFPHYADVPRFYTQNPTIWAELLERAETETVRLAILGDSQETCPNGAGSIRPTDAPPSPFSPIRDSGTINLGLAGPGDPMFLIGSTPPLDYGGLAYMVLETMGTDSEAFTNFLGVRFRNLAHPQGMVIDSFSGGGMDVQELLVVILNWGPC